MSVRHAQILVWSSSAGYEDYGNAIIIIHAYFLALNNVHPE